MDFISKKLIEDISYLWRNVFQLKGEDLFMQKVWSQHKKKILILTLTLAIIFSIPFVSKATDYTQHQFDIITEIYSLIK